MKYDESEAETLRREREHENPPQSPSSGIKNYGFFASCCIISAILGLIAVAWLVIYPKIGNPTEEGTVYVITNGKEVIKMPGVTVLIMDTQTLRTKMATASRTLRSDFLHYKTRFDEATTEIEKASAEADWGNRQDSLVAAAIAVEIADDNLSEALHQTGKRLFQETKTDMNGHFAFQLPKPGDYITVAYADRDILGETENYFWLRLGHLNKFLGYNCDLNNDFNLSVPGSHLGPDTKVRALMEKFGLQVQELAQ